jgi:hypothetical protein
MLKKILIGLAVVLVAAGAYAAYVFTRPPVSPYATASYNNDGLDIKVTYSQPSKKGRLIFGEVAQDALQPYGVYWRLGANAATEITFNKDVTFGGQPISAGTYRMYAVPGPTSFKVILNSETGVTFDAASDADHSLDVISVDAPVQKNLPPVETFLISFQPDSAGVRMDMAWDDVLFSVPIAGK